MLDPSIGSYYVKTNPLFIEASHTAPEKFIQTLTVSGVIHNLLPVTLGNILGGAIGNRNNLLANI